MSKKNNDNGNNGNNDDDKDYKVGYGKPPKNTRFGAINGNRINRSGAPSKAQKIMQDRFSHEAMRQAFLDAGREMITINEGGEQIRISKMEALPKTILNAALRGNTRAFDLCMRYMDRYAKDQDQALLDLYDVSSKMEERRFKASLNPGTREHYEAMHNYFMFRRTMRKIEGAGEYPYLEDEPKTTEDWQVFMEYYESFDLPEVIERAWPPLYPSTTEEMKYENMSTEELARDHLEIFKHSKKMREKEGLHKWPYTVEEPVDDEDWQHFTQYIQDKIDGKDNPAPWPPAYWDDDQE